MRILFLTQIVPYPPDAGPRVKTWNVLRYLAEQGHHIELLTYVRPEEEAHLETLNGVCSAVHPVAIRRSRFGDGIYLVKSLLTGRPFLVERDDRRVMRQKVKVLLDRNEFDVVHADQLTMAQFALPILKTMEHKSNESERGHRPYLVMDAHNAVWTILDRMNETVAWPLKAPLAFEARRLKQYEGRIVTKFNRTLAVSSVDRQALLGAVEAYQGYADGASEKIQIIPIAINTDQLTPLIRDTRSNHIVTLGTLHYPPNADGIRWFLNEVFPKILAQIPRTTLTIIGKNPPDDLVRLAQAFDKSVNVTGYVPVLESHLKKAAAMVIPVRVGGGMRVRILEGFAREIPMVTTTVGLEGIEAKSGEHILVADEPTEFAKHVVDLLTDPSLNKRIAGSGRRLAESSYDWQAVLPKLDEVYQSVFSQ